MTGGWAPSFTHWNLNCTGHLSVASCHECVDISPAACVAGSVSLFSERPCNHRMEEETSARRKTIPHSSLALLTTAFCRCLTPWGPWSYCFLPGMLASGLWGSLPATSISTRTEALVPPLHNCQPALCTHKLWSQIASNAEQCVQKLCRTLCPQRALSTPSPDL